MLLQSPSLVTLTRVPVALLQHLRNKQVHKPLVALLAGTITILVYYNRVVILPPVQGDTGIGKSTFERALRKNVLFRSMEAGGITVINGADYLDPALVLQYRESIRHRIADAILRCSHSFILVDEVHYMVLS